MQSHQRQLHKLLLARDIDLDPSQCRASSLSAGDHAPPQILANTQWHGTELRGSRLTLFVSLIRPAAGLQAAEPNIRVSESTLSELEKTKIEMKKWLELPSISEVVVIKNADGTTSEHDLDVLAWWRDTGEKDFPRIAVMARQYLAIPASSATAERVFSFAGLTLSDLRKSLLDGTLEAIMWAKCGFPNVPLGRGNLVETNPELCD